MNSIKKLLLSIFLTFCFCSVWGTRNFSTFDNEAGSDKWIRKTFLNGSQFPFSFSLNGRPSSEFLGSWKKSLNEAQSSEPNSRSYILTLTSPDNTMRVDCNILAFDDFPAAEWKLNFTNIGKTNSPQISDIRSTDILLSGKDFDYTIYTARGSNAKDLDFHLVKIPIEKDSVYSFSPTGGRSSSATAFPFYNIDAGNCGVFAAIGWTGNWNALMAMNKDKNFSISVGIPMVDTYLLPGESIRTPNVALLFWSGTDRMDGHNAFRSFLLAHHSPRNAQGKLATPPLSNGFDYGDPSPCGEYEALTELFARAVVDRCSRFGLNPEVYWLDAGWYSGCNAPESSYEGRNWYNQVGNWIPDPNRFPNGLKPLSDAVHASGSKLMVWMEPERVYEGSQFDSICAPWLLHSESWPRHRLLNIGNKDACDFLCNFIGDFFEENGIDLYRQDFNISPTTFWYSSDEPGRKGMTEIRYIEGLYRYWDYLLDRFPDLIIDNCASGGRRLDLETISRSMPLWRTDCNYGEPNCQQCHTYGLSQFLPIHGTAAFWADKYHSRSAISSSYTCFLEYFNRDSSVDDMKRAMQEYRQLREFTLCDFYPLSGDEDTTPTDRWIAWQYHDSSKEAGFIQAFRRANAIDKEYKVNLRGLDNSAKYEITDCDSGEIIIKTGMELASGLNLVAEQPLSALLLTYRKI